MDLALKAALQGPSFRPFTAVRIELHNGDVLRLLNGDLVLTIGGETYTGRDDTYGSCGDVEDIADGAADQGPAIRIDVFPPTLTATDALLDPANQGASVQVIFGVVDPLTGLPIGTETLFLGEVDVPTFTPPAQSRSVEFDCASVFDRFLDRDEGQRLSDRFWNTVFPGDTGLEDMVVLSKKVPWGMATVGAAGPTFVSTGSVGDSVASRVLALQQGRG